MHHGRRPVQQTAEIDATQGGRHQTEVGKRRITSTDIRRVQKRPAEAARLGLAREGRPWIGNGEKLPRVPSSTVPEIVVMRERLQRRARFGSDQKHRSFHVDLLLEGGDRRRVGGVHHMNRQRAGWGLEGAGKHFGRQAAAPHTEDDRMAKALLVQLLRQRLQLRNPLLHPVGHLQPAEPVADLFLDGAVRFPERCVLLLDATDHRVLLELAKSLLDRRLQGAKARLVRSNVAVVQLPFLVRDLLQELVDRIGEQLDAVDLEVVGDLLHVDADRRQIPKQLLGACDIFRQARPHLAVLFEGHHGLLRHRVHGFRPDQFLDVQHVTVMGVLRAGARP